MQRPVRIRYSGVKIRVIEGTGLPDRLPRWCSSGPGSSCIGCVPSLSPAWVTFSNREKDVINGRGTFDAREAERLALLEYLDAARPEADSVLQGLVDDARHAFGTDLALINLILPEEYAESRLGREHSMCARVC